MLNKTLTGLKDAVRSAAHNRFIILELLREAKALVKTVNEFRS